MPKKKPKRKVDAPLPFVADRASQRWHVDPPAGWSTDHSSVWFFPLEWFLSDVDELDLGLCRIRRLNERDIEAMVAAQEKVDFGPFGMLGMPGQSWGDFSNREWPWVLDVVVPASEFETARGFADYVRRSVEVAMRLVGNKYVFTTGPIVIQPLIEGSLAGQYSLSPHDFDLTQLPEHLYFRLDASLAGELQATHKAAFDTNDARTRIALRRFASGYGRGNDDGLIDLWIGLEALFSDREGEITYKAAMRITHYVASALTGRRFLFRCLKKSYEARSDLVHGDPIDGTKAARQVASYCLRLALIRALTDGVSPNIAALDDVIAAGSA